MFIIIGSVFLGVLVAVAIIGIFGTIYDNVCLLITYICCVWALFIAFWVIFAILKAGKGISIYVYHYILAHITDEISDLCNNNKASGFVAELEKVYPTNLASSFCTANCPCKAIRGRFPLTADYESAVFQTTGATTVQQCKNSVYTAGGPSNSAIKFMRLMERRYRCSGICKKEKWFYFSNVGLGAPLMACNTEILNYVEGIFQFLLFQ